MKARTTRKWTRSWFTASALLGTTMLALYITATGAAHAQQKSLEELQKELDEAKKTMTAKAKPTAEKKPGAAGTTSNLPSGLIPELAFPFVEGRKFRAAQSFTDPRSAMVGCHREAGNRVGEFRKAFMRGCLCSPATANTSC